MNENQPNDLKNCVTSDRSNNNNSCSVRIINKSEAFTKNNLQIMAGVNKLDFEEKVNVKFKNSSFNDSKCGLINQENNLFGSLNKTDKIYKNINKFSDSTHSNYATTTSLHKIPSYNVNNGQYLKLDTKSNRRIEVELLKTHLPRDVELNDNSLNVKNNLTYSDRCSLNEDFSHHADRKLFAEDSLVSQQNIPNKINELGETSNNKIQKKETNKNLDNYNELDVKNNKEILNSRTLTRREKIYDSISEEEEEFSQSQKEVNFIILPDNQYKRAFDIAIALIIIYSSIVLPYQIAFIDVEDESNIIIENILDVFLYADIFLNFFSAYNDREDNLIKDRKKIIRTYLKSWFIIDFLSVLPISYFSDTPNSKYNALARIGRIPKLYRLIRLTKLFRMVKMLKRGNVTRVTKFFLEKLKLNANIEKLIYFIFGFLLLNHLSACIWYFVAKLQDLNPDCWVTRLGYIDASNIEIYIVSYYWTLTTVTTVGYGDINAGTTIERIYNLFIMSFGVLMYSFAIGSLSSIVSTIDKKTADMNSKLQILSSIKKEFSLDQEIYDKVRKVIKYDLSRNQKDKLNLLRELPNKLRIELSQIMHDSVVQKMYFFIGQSSDFVAFVAPLLKPVKLSQNDYLYKISDLIDEMYFISKGTISFCLGEDYLEKEIKEIKKHNNFGEIEMCLNEKLTYNIKVKSRNCELFVLRKNDFLRLSVNFKNFIEKFLERSLEIYLKFNEERKNFIKIMDFQRKNSENLNDSSKFNIAKTETLEIVDEERNEDGSDVYELIENKSYVENNLLVANDSSSENSKRKFKNTFDNIHEIFKKGMQLEKKKTRSRSSNILKGIKKSCTNNTLRYVNNNYSEENNCNSSNENKDINEECDNNILSFENCNNEEKIKNKMNDIFIVKVKKIINFLEKKKIEINKEKYNHLLSLLMNLKDIHNYSERNYTIKKIESVVAEILYSKDIA